MTNDERLFHLLECCDGDRLTHWWRRLSEKEQLEFLEVFFDVLLTYNYDKYRPLLTDLAAHWRDAPTRH
jgi:hypothetical protein